MTQRHSAPVKIVRRVRHSATNRPVIKTVCNSLTLPEYDAAVEDWLLDTEARLSPKTAVDRKFLTDKLSWWLRWQNCQAVGRTELQRFFAYLPTAHTQPGGRWGTAEFPATAARATTPLRPRTCGNYFRWLRTFFLYLVSCGTLDESPMNTLRPAKHRDDQIQPFSMAQVESLLEEAAKSKNPLRNIALLLTFLDTGVRVGEVVKLTVADLNTRERSIRVLGKGNLHRTLYLQPRTMKAIMDYLRSDQRADSEPLFCGLGQEPFHENGVLQLMRRLGKVAEIEGVRCSPHTFRHTFAIEFLRNGGDPLTLQTLYGHSDLAMTRRYVAIAGADMKRAHAKYSPVVGLKVPRGKR